MTQLRFPLEMPTTGGSAQHVHHCLLRFQMQVPKVSPQRAETLQTLETAVEDGVLFVELACMNSKRKMRRKVGLGVCGEFRKGSWAV